MLLSNILNLFYQITLTVFRTTNVSVHQAYTLFDTMYFHLNEVKTTINASKSSNKNLIIKVCEKVELKLSKYYIKIVDKNDTIYDIVMILNFIQKISLFKR